MFAHTLNVLVIDTSFNIQTTEAVWSCGKKVKLASVLSQVSAHVLPFGGGLSKGNRLWDTSDTMQTLNLSIYTRKRVDYPDCP